MNRKLLLLLGMLLSTTSNAAADNMLGAHDHGTIVDQVRKQIETECRSDQPCSEEAIQCFLTQLHQLKEEQTLCDDIFRRLRHYGELKYAFCRGLLDGRTQCSDPRLNPGKGPGKPPTENREKVLICHIPPGNPDNAHTISVGSAAVAAHLAHGDSLGACAGDEDEDNGKDKSKGKKGK